MRSFAPRTREYERAVSAAAWIPSRRFSMLDCNPQVCVGTQVCRLTAAVGVAQHKTNSARTMAFDLFLAPADARRAARVLEKLARRGLRDFAGTGGLAIEAHLVGHSTRLRSLNDVDIVVESFGAIPAALADGFLFRHIHPHAPQGKTLAQLVDPGEALRVDIFRAYGATLARSVPMNFRGGPMAVVALKDLAAREASLLMDLARGTPVPVKHARDFQRLIHDEAATCIGELIQSQRICWLFPTIRAMRMPSIQSARRLGPSGWLRAGRSGRSWGIAEETNEERVLEEPRTVENPPSETRSACVGVGMVKA